LAQKNDAAARGLTNQPGIDPAQVSMPSDEPCTWSGSVTGLVTTRNFVSIDPPG
jgi:hypothetical protein